MDSQRAEMVSAIIVCIDLDDISEIRAGKFSFDIDGQDSKPRITIVATEASICLPMPTRKLRDKLLTRFQAFLSVNSRIGNRNPNGKKKENETECSVKILQCEEPLLPRNSDWNPTHSIEMYFSK